MRYRWCQIGELLAFLLPNPAAAVTGNYILCREITSVWRRFELSLEKGQKNQDWTGGKKEVRVVFSEVQAFGEESKTAAAVFVVVIVVFINMQQDRLSELPPAFPSGTSSAALAREALQALARLLAAASLPASPTASGQQLPGTGWLQESRVLKL